MYEQGVAERKNKQVVWKEARDKWDARGDGRPHLCTGVGMVPRLSNRIAGTGNLPSSPRWPVSEIKR